MRFRVNHRHFDAELGRPRVVFSGVAARVHGAGDGMHYDHPRPHVEYRSREELARIVPQMIGLPITREHPERMLADGGGGAEIIGSVLGARMDGDLLVVDYEVIGLDAAHAIADGLSFLSLGYLADTRARTDGAFDQYDLKPDHLAVVEAARCGATCATRTDAAPTKKPCSCGGQS